MVENRNHKKRIQVWMDANLNQEAAWVLEELGLTQSAAITMFYQQLVLKQGIPFPVDLKTSDKRLKK